MLSDDSIVKNEHIQSMSEILHRLAHLWHISIELTSIICIACYSCMRTRRLHFNGNGCHEVFYRAYGKMHERR